METDIRTLYNFFVKFPKVITDSRKVEKGSIFFALKGDNFDGNKYAQQALDKGAELAVVDNKEYLNKENFYVVDEVLKTLQSLASYHRNQLKTKILELPEPMVKQPPRN